MLVENVNVNGGGTGVQSVFVGKGALFDQNVYNLDGVAVTDPAGGTPGLYFDFDSFENIEVATGGSDPSLSAPGVTLNLVTRRGTNELRGSARAFYFFPSSVGSSNQLSSQGTWDYGLEAGGPIWKDRVWLWAAGAGNNIPGETVLLPDGEPFRSTNDLSQWNAKLNAQIVPANTLTLYLPSQRQDLRWGVRRPPNHPACVLEPDDASVRVQSGGLGGPFGEASSPICTSPT